MIKINYSQFDSLELDIIEYFLNLNHLWKTKNTHEIEFFFFLVVAYLFYLKKKKKKMNTKKILCLGIYLK